MSDNAAWKRRPFARCLRKYVSLRKMSSKWANEQMSTRRPSEHERMILNDQKGIATPRDLATEQPSNREGERKRDRERTWNWGTRLICILRRLSKRSQQRRITIDKFILYQKNHPRARKNFYLNDICLFNCLFFKDKYHFIKLLLQMYLWIIETSTFQKISKSLQMESSLLEWDNKFLGLVHLKIKIVS